MFEGRRRTVRRRLACWIGVISLVVLADVPRARAQEVPLTSPAASPAPSPSTTTSTATSTNATAPDAAPAEAPLSDAAPAASTADPGLAQVQLKLDAVKDERAHTSNLLPWLSVGVGAGAVLIGASVGAGYTMGCDDHCETPNWVTFAIVAGATVATLGAIWVLHRDADIRELESQRYQLEQELLRIRLSSPQSDRGPAARSAFSLRFAL